jgi:glycosyltransferase involved in cell wall biosynthesis
MEFPSEQIEVIYVDSQSSDDSVARARALGAQAVPLPPGPPTAARGRNAGYRLARGTFLFFLDGDTIVAPAFLSRALAFLESHPKTAVYYGHRRELHPESSIYNRIFDLDWLSPCGESSYCGGDAVIRRDVLDRFGPYRDDLIAGEEPELCTRIRAAGYGIWHADELMTRHDLAITRFGAYWRRCYRGGHAYAEVAERTDGTLFKRESVRNHLQAVVYLVAPLIFVLILGWKGISVLAAAAVLIVLRTAWRARWRKASLATTLLHSVHCHVCQIPIWFGQLAYLRNRRREAPSRIIEYK